MRRAADVLILTGLTISSNASELVRVPVGMKSSPTRYQRGFPQLRITPGCGLRLHAFQEPVALSESTVMMMMMGLGTPHTQTASSSGPVSPPWRPTDKQDAILASLVLAPLRPAAAPGTMASSLLSRPRVTYSKRSETDID